MAPGMYKKFESINFLNIQHIRLIRNVIYQSRYCHCCDNLFIMCIILIDYRKIYCTTVEIDGAGIINCGIFCQGPENLLVVLDRIERLFRKQVHVYRNISYLKRWRIEEKNE